MGAWALNCITLFVLLYLVVSGEQMPTWRDLLLTINALLLALVPAILYAWFLRANGQGSHG